MLITFFATCSQLTHEFFMFFKKWIKKLKCPHFPMKDMENNKNGFFYLKENHLKETEIDCVFSRFYYMVDVWVFLSAVKHQNKP